MEITITKTPEFNDTVFLWSQLRTHGLSQLSNPVMEEKFPFGIIAREGEEIIGGVLGEMYYRGLHIDLVWVSEPLRKTGLGTALIRKAEELARESSCTLIYLDTFSFQAPEFYEKLGFEVFGKIENFPENYTRYFLLKRIV
ncbi:MAG: GNAT family N-acetyltransferase [Leptospiraceae bacterium]|nr:GNAT family N-acetyltransferase [Leptospiraceae bacterium]MBK9499211.1 GNAT family N-acetyltransferase [Leptospiraceae bacterium]MBK9502902.1 GNAT family N-acetyltransferase [Leptospiraceae bacterium]